MAAIPTPVRVSIRDLLGDLVGTPVTVSAAEAPMELDTSQACYAATYRFDDGRAAALAVYDLPAAVSMAAAIGSMSRADADAEVAQHHGLAGELHEHFREVVNVMAKLLNSPTSPHVVLGEVDAVPGQIRADAARVALRPSVRVDLGVQVQGFDGGRMTLLTA